MTRRDASIDQIEYEQTLLSRFTNAQRRRAGLLDRSVYLLLSRIDTDGPLSIGELSEHLGLDPSTLQRQTSAAIRDGLLERIEDPDGGAARKLALTPDGQARFVSERTRSTASLGRILSDWSDDDIAHFAALLDRFNTDIEAYSAHRRA